MTLREREHTPSELRALLGREPLEALALALALRAPPEPCSALGHRPARRRARDLRRRPAGGGRARRARRVGRALEETLRRKLDGLVSGRDEELETALLLAREHAQ